MRKLPQSPSPAAIFGLFGSPSSYANARSYKPRRNGAIERSVRRPVQLQPFARVEVVNRLKPLGHKVKT